MKAEGNALMTLNERLRDDYITDCQAGVDRWNRALEKQGVAARLRLPHKAFHRKIGAFAGMHVSPEGELLDAATWSARARDWLPSDR